MGEKKSAEGLYDGQRISEEEQRDTLNRMNKKPKDWEISDFHSFI